MLLQLQVGNLLPSKKQHGNCKYYDVSECMKCDTPIKKCALCNQRKCEYPYCKKCMPTETGYD